MPARPRRRPQESPASPSPVAKRAWRPLGVAAGLLLAGWVCAFLVYGSWRSQFPAELDYGEGGILLEAANLAQGQNVYNDYRHAPYVVASYPPVFPAVCAAGVRLFGVSFVFGRVVVMGATLAIAALLWAILRRRGAGPAACAVAAALFVATPIVRRWGVVMRVDLPALALGLLGLYLVLRGGRWRAAAVVLFALALYTKPTAVAPLLAATVFLWWQGERRAAGILLGGTAALALAAGGLLQAGTGGWFYRHVVVSNQNRWSAELLGWLWRGTLTAWPAPFVLAAGAAAWGGWRLARRTGPAVDWALGSYALLALAVSLAAGKAGANAYYLVEATAACCLVAGRLLDRALAWPRAGKAGGWALWAAALGALAFSLQAAIPTLYPSVQWQQASEQARQLISLARRAPGEVLSEMPGIPVAAGRPVVLEPFEFAQMARDGLWDERPLLADIRGQRFAVAMLSQTAHGGLDRTRWTPAMQEALMRAYRPWQTVGNFGVWLPRGRPAGRGGS